MKAYPVRRKSLIDDINKEETLSAPGDWGVFQQKLAKSKARAESRVWLLTSMRGALAVLMLVFTVTVIMMVRDASETVLTSSDLKNGFIPVSLMSQGSLYRFKEISRWVLGRGNNLVFSPESRIRLEEKKSDAAVIELEEGKLTISNDAGAKNVVRIGGVELREIGTHYTVESHGGKAVVKVYSGQVLAQSRLSNRSLLVSAGQSCRVDGLSHDIALIAEKPAISPRVTFASVSSLIEAGAVDVAKSEDRLIACFPESVAVYKSGAQSAEETVGYTFQDTPITLASDGRRHVVAGISGTSWFYLPDMGSWKAVRTGRVARGNVFIRGDVTVMVNRLGRVFVYEGDNASETASLPVTAACDDAAVMDDNGRIWLADNSGRLAVVNTDLGCIEQVLRLPSPALSALSMQGRYLHCATAEGNVVVNTDAGGMSTYK